MRRDVVLRVASFAALAIAIVVVIRHGLHPLESQNIDANLYASSAYNLIRGHGYVGTFEGATVESWFPPGLPVLLAPWTFVGTYPTNVQVVSVGINVLLVVLMWQLARETAGEIAGAVTSVLTAGSVLLIVYGSRVLSVVPSACAALGAWQFNTPTDGSTFARRSQPQ